ELLDGGHAHVTFEDAIADWPPELRSAKPAGQPFTPWRVVEHIRISQWDFVEFTKSAKHVSPEWPAGYWPASDAPPDAAAWDTRDRKSTRLNSSHVSISYAVFCLKKKKKDKRYIEHQQYD